MHPLYRTLIAYCHRYCIRSTAPTKTHHAPSLRGPFTPGMPPACCPMPMPPHCTAQQCISSIMCLWCCRHTHSNFRSATPDSRLEQRQHCVARGLTLNPSRGWYSSFSVSTQWHIHCCAMYMLCTRHQRYTRVAMLRWFTACLTPAAIDPPSSTCQCTQGSWWG